MSITVPAAASFLRKTPDASLILVGKADAIESALAREAGVDRSRVEIRAASEVVAMDDPPAVALRSRR
ncbi:MAG TPA: phosphate acyltransferase, partial [Quisquiliibacterium sp.]|nr:phosphate acyltransferase [Quisquiliibacterium sp.]